jgi:hypothetical protein
MTVVPLGLVTDNVYGGGAVPGVEVEVGVEVDIEEVLRLARTSASLCSWCRKESDGGIIVNEVMLFSFNGVCSDMTRVKKKSATGCRGI